MFKDVNSHSEFVDCVIIMRVDEAMDIIAVDGVEPIAMEVVTVLVAEDDTLDVFTADRILYTSMPTLI